MMGRRRGWRGGRWFGGNIVSGGGYWDQELEVSVPLSGTHFFSRLQIRFFSSFLLSAPARSPNSVRDTRMFSTEILKSLGRSFHGRLADLRYGLSTTYTTSFSAMQALSHFYLFFFSEPEYLWFWTHFQLKFFT